MSSRKLKVWGGGTFTLDGNRKSARAIVAAYSKKQAVELLNRTTERMSRHHFDGYWGETGNKAETLNCGEPGVWVSVGTDWSGKFRRILLLL